jgi:hypothetical protein
MNIRCNAGVTRTSMIGDLPGYDGEVWYNPKGIANILSLSNVEKYYQVTYDSRAEKAFVVHKADGNERRFKQSEKGLTHERMEYHGVPRGIMERHQDVTLCVDIMFVNQIPFFITISRNIKFRTIEVPKNRKNPTILQAFKNVNAIYNNRGFRITMGYTDNEFEPMRGDFLDLGVELNVASNDEHVPEIEH